MVNLEKLFSEAKKRNKVENFAHFEKECVFLERRHFSSVSYFFRYRRRSQIFVSVPKNETCQINLKDTSFDSVFCADSEYVFSL